MSHMITGGEVSAPLKTLWKAVADVPLRAATPEDLEKVAGHMRHVEVYLRKVEFHLAQADERLLEMDPDQEGADALEGLHTNVVEALALACALATALFPPSSPPPTDGYAECA